MAVKRKTIANFAPRQLVAIEHTGFYHYLVRYSEAMLIRNHSMVTIRRCDGYLRRFIAWCDERGLEKPQDITKPILESYQKHLFYYRQENGKPLSCCSRNNVVKSLKKFFKWLTQENYLLYNPASELFMLKEPSALPIVLTLDEVERLMLQPNINTPYGLRDRAILEVLYSTGIRRAELGRLQQQDVSLARQTLFVRCGKNSKDRLLPLGERAAQWVTRYLNDARSQLLLDNRESSLFLTDYGEPFCQSRLGNKIKRYMQRCGIDVPGACHLLRHAMATHMLENGAELRYIQMMLGHTQITTTQIYTHVSIRKLQEVHAATHPAKLEDRNALLEQLQLESEEENYQDCAD